MKIAVINKNKIKFEIGDLVTFDFLGYPVKHDLNPGELFSGGVIAKVDKNILTIVLVLLERL